MDKILTEEKFPKQAQNLANRIKILLKTTYASEIGFEVHKATN